MNGNNILTVSYDLKSYSETVLNRDLGKILNVKYNKAGQPISFVPGNYFKPMNLTYNAHGLLTSWRQEDLGEMYLYDEHGFLEQIQKGTDTLFRYIYRSGSKVR